MTRVPGGLWKNFIAVQVYGANTGVGKTVFSTLLGAHFARKISRERWGVQYIKPVSTGPQNEADDRYVRKYAQAPVLTLHQFPDPVSPHVAAQSLANIPDDDSIVSDLHNALLESARKFSPHSNSVGISGTKGIGIVETAGGPLSPGPSGTLQADLFRPLRLPVILVGDHRLGGISSTISAAESLTIRGYDIDAVVCFDDKGKYQNPQYLREYFSQRGIRTFELPWIPNLEGCTAAQESQRMQKYYDEQSGSKHTEKIAERIVICHSQRLKTLDNLKARTKAAIWFPFTQHKTDGRSRDISVFDSAYGDYFQAKHNRWAVTLTEDESKEVAVLNPLFDGSASWWTQGLGHGNPRLALAVAYAAGRYGHVMFAGATHLPAIKLAETLLRGMDNPRLSKCFYSDDGSTAAEVGIKMALRAACKRYDWDSSLHDIGVLGLKGSYHGDTIGAMDASEPCVYNKKVDWYRGRGYWFDFPTVKMRMGTWFVEAPAGMEAEFGPPQSFVNLSDVFEFDKRPEAEFTYEQYIYGVLHHLVKEEGRKFGALIMEPILLGAGGMLFVDPLFQRTLVKVVRNFQFHWGKPIQSTLGLQDWAGVPVMFDEVFTGLYRLGRFSAASFLETHPDISIHAKLLTGGLLPLSVTLASESIFDAFLGYQKADALLHGHSYTAHPVGCHVANTSLKIMEELSRSVDRFDARRYWAADDAMDRRLSERVADTKAWSVWNKDTVVKLSLDEKVDYVIAIGTVFAIALKDDAGAGYTSTAAIALRDALLHDYTKRQLGVHTRVLGNVIYFMASQTSSSKDLREVEKVLLRRFSPWGKDFRLWRPGRGQIVRNRPQDAT